MGKYFKFMAEVVAIVPDESDKDAEICVLEMVENVLKNNTALIDLKSFEVKGVDSSEVRGSKLGGQQNYEVAILIEGETDLPENDSKSYDMMYKQMVNAFGKEYLTEFERLDEDAEDEYQVRPMDSEGPQRKQTYRVELTGTVTGENSEYAERDYVEHIEMLLNDKLNYVTSFEQLYIESTEVRHKKYEVTVEYKFDAVIDVDDMGGNAEGIDEFVYEDIYGAINTYGERGLYGVTIGFFEPYGEVSADVKIEDDKYVIQERGGVSVANPKDEIRQLKMELKELMFEASMSDDPDEISSLTDQIKSIREDLAELSSTAGDYRKSVVRGRNGRTRRLANDAVENAQIR